jgi:hypothetical protein
LVPAGRAPPSRQKRQLFFSEEKKQKTFSSLSRLYPAADNQETKVFWFFFSKKNCFTRRLLRRLPIIALGV